MTDQLQKFDIRVFPSGAAFGAMNGVRPLIESALARRAGIATATTNALRLIDGVGDGLPGIELETFADRWLLSTTDEIPRALLDWLRQQRRSVYWKRLDVHQKSSPEHLCGPLVTEPFLAMEQGMHTEISFHAGYSQGIFLDQRDNRAEVKRRFERQGGGRFLNTFAYTGMFSVAAALGGAVTTTLDLSQPYLDWAKRNLAHNGIDPQEHYFCKGDTFQWLRRFAKQGRRFDGVVLDPPTFSRDEKGKVFRAEKDFGELAALAAAVVEPGGWILCCTNFRGIGPSEFERMVKRSLSASVTVRHAEMPADFTAPAYLKSMWVGSLRDGRRS